MNQKGDGHKLPSIQILFVQKATNVRINFISLNHIAIKQYLYYHLTKILYLSLIQNITENAYLDRKLHKSQHILNFHLIISSIYDTF